MPIANTQNVVVPGVPDASPEDVEPLFMDDMPGQEPGHEWWLHEAQRPVATAALVCGALGALVLLACHPHDAIVPVPLDVASAMPGPLLLSLRVVGWLLCVAAVSLGVAGRQAYGRRVAAAVGIALGIVPAVVALINLVTALVAGFGVLVATGIVVAVLVLLLMMLAG